MTSSPTTTTRTRSPTSSMRRRRRGRRGRGGGGGGRPAAGQDRHARSDDEEDDEDEPDPDDVEEDLDTILRDRIAADRRRRGGGRGRDRRRRSQRRRRRRQPAAARGVHLPRVLPARPAQPVHRSAHRLPWRSRQPRLPDDQGLPRLTVAPTPRGDFCPRSSARQHGAVSGDDERTTVGPGDGPPGLRTPRVRPRGPHPAAPARRTGPEPGDHGQDGRPVRGQAGPGEAAPARPVTKAQARASMLLDRPRAQAAGDAQPRPPPATRSDRRPSRCRRRPVR